MMRCPWTKLQGTDIWAAAAVQYRANGLEYHNIDHIVALYGHAEKLGLPYSERLDQNILGHDVIQHRGAGVNEDLSKIWLLSVSGKGPESDWADPILATKEHRPSQDETGLAMLDLADFMDVHASRRNTELLRREAATKAGTNFDQKAWVAGSMQYLDGLRSRILEDLPAMQDHPHLQIWERIVRGITITMECMPHRYDRHPASGIQRYTRDIEDLVFRLSDEGACTLEDIRNGDMGAVRAEKAIGGIVWHDLVFLRKNKESGPVMHLTDHARDWVAAMRAPDPDHPSP